MTTWMSGPCGCLFLSPAPLKPFFSLSAEVSLSPHLPLSQFTSRGLGIVLETQLLSCQFLSLTSGLHLLHFWGILILPQISYFSFPCSPSVHSNVSFSEPILDSAISGPHPYLFLVLFFFIVLITIYYRFIDIIDLFTDCLSHTRMAWG